MYAINSIASFSLSVDGSSDTMALLTRAVRLIDSAHRADCADGDGIRQEFRFGRDRMYPANDCHPFSHETKGRSALTIREAPATEIELRLVADTDEKTPIRLPRRETAHRHDAVAMLQTGKRGR